MRRQRLSSLLLLGVLAGGLVSQPEPAWSHLVDEDTNVIFVRPLFTEPTWTETQLAFDSMGFDLRHAVSHPNAQVGFVFTPSLRWSLWRMLELQVGFPMVVNPDAQGDREIEAAKNNPELRSSPATDSHPDFDLPGVICGLKWDATELWGSRHATRLRAALGVLASVPIEKLATHFLPPKTLTGHTNSLRLLPYLAVGYSLGRFSPQLQLGLSVRFPDQTFDPLKPPTRTAGLVNGKGYLDGFFSLALPFAALFERTAPMLEIIGVVGEQGAQISLSPAVTFLPRRGNARLGFAAQFPVLDGDWRGSEGFRFLVTWSYQLENLSLGQREPEGAEGASEHVEEAREP